jgi:hypothetical protein
MSYSQLRSVSPVHCEYLQNMGVDASMSISIMVEGELWGLIACHHYSPKAVPLPQRVGAELFGQYFSLQVETLERRERLRIRIPRWRPHCGSTAWITTGAVPPETMIAAGAAIRRQGEVRDQPAQQVHPCYHHVEAVAACWRSDFALPHAITCSSDRKKADSSTGVGAGEAGCPLGDRLTPRSRSVA